MHWLHFILTPRSPIIIRSQLSIVIKAVSFFVSSATTRKLKLSVVIWCKIWHYIFFLTTYYRDGYTQHRLITLLVCTYVAICLAVWSLYEASFSGTFGMPTQWARCHRLSTKRGLLPDRQGNSRSIREYRSGPHALASLLTTTHYIRLFMLSTKGSKGAQRYKSSLIAS